jgi:hypothetical protein
MNITNSKPNAKACCNVFNLQQNGLSRKMLISKMIRCNKSINYANSLTSSIYMSILSLNYEANKKLMILLKHVLYMKYVKKLLLCSNLNSHEIYSMIESIITNLTPDEYTIVFNIITPTPIKDIIITKTFYVSLDINKKFFIIKNYNMDYFTLI